MISAALLLAAARC